MATFAPSFKIISTQIGSPNGANGSQAINALSTTQLYPLGTRVRAVDSVLGEAEFIYCVGVASTAAGDFVQINPDFTTTRAAGGTAKGPVGIAMSACVANRYGWYCVYGRVPVTIAADVGAIAPAYGAAAGVLADDVAATKQVVGCILDVALDAGGSAITGTSDTTAAHQAIAFLQYPNAIVAV